MTLLADELLEDIAEDEAASDNSSEKDLSEDQVKQMNEKLEAELMKAKDIKYMAKLLHSGKLQDALQQINHYQNSIEEDGSFQNMRFIEEHPEYQLIINANNLLVDIDSEIALIHKFIKQQYAKKFTELESLVLNPLDYARVVRAIGNEMDLTKIDLNGLLPTMTVMIVTVTASTTNGEPLSDNEIRAVMEACDMALQLDDSRRLILDYIEKRMNFIAPNLSNIVGCTVAAKLMGLAGGLQVLSKIPSCNIQLLGKTKRILSGFSTMQISPHVGYIYQCDLIMKTPPDYRKKAARLIASKCALAARIDSFHEVVDGMA